jgi:hypothetical protein
MGVDEGRVAIELLTLYLHFSLRCHFFSSALVVRVIPLKLKLLNII